MASQMGSGSTRRTAQAGAAVYAAGAPNGPSEAEGRPAFSRAVSGSWRGSGLFSVEKASAGRSRDASF